MTYQCHVCGQIRRGTEQQPCDYCVRARAWRAFKLAVLRAMRIPQIADWLNRRLSR